MIRKQLLVKIAVPLLMYSENIADGEKTPSRSKPMAKKTQFCENGSAQEKTPIKMI